MKPGNVMSFVLASLLVGLLLFLFIAAHVREEKMPCSSIMVRLYARPLNTSGFLRRSFLTRMEIMAWIDQYYADALIGHPVRDIDIGRLERVLESCPFIRSAEAYTATAGTLVLEVAERMPLLRIINMEGVSYYVDENGRRMPLNDNFTPPVLLATGFLFDPDYKKDTIGGRTLGQLFGLAGFIERHRFWKAAVEEVYVNMEQEFELIPRIGNHVVLFGDTTEMNDKFDKLLMFYKKAAPGGRLDVYRAIDLRYRGQVVCIRKEMPEQNRNRIK